MLSINPTRRAGSRASCASTAWVANLQSDHCKVLYANPDALIPFAHADSCEFNCAKMAFANGWKFSAAPGQKRLSAHCPKCSTLRQARTKATPRKRRRNAGPSDQSD